MLVCPMVGFQINIRINLQLYKKNPAKILIRIDFYLEINYISLLALFLDI